MTVPWQADWFAASASRRRTLWRGVEAQHQVATMRLVDDLAEQELLEQLLEASKPPLPQQARGAHYLVATPFRYVSPQPSRFRRPHEPGVWYGADEPATVAAEVAFWRWRFLMDSDGLRGQQVLAELTFFQAAFDGTELDITQPPWSTHRATWRANDYTQCHALAAAVRALDEPPQAIRYESARREGGLCQAVFDPQALAIRKPAPQQTWVCKTTAQRVLMTHESDRLQFEWA
jgi:hypothetical protein